MNVVQTFSHEPEHLFADEYPQQTIAGTVLSGVVADKWTALTRNAAGKFVLTTATDKIEAICVTALEGTGGDQVMPLYVSGSFNFDAITFHADIDTLIEAQALAVPPLFFKELN